MRTSFKAAGEEPTGTPFRTCRRMLAGSRINQPQEHEGHNGFVGCAGWPVRLQFSPRDADLYPFQFRGGTC